MRPQSATVPAAAAAGLQAFLLLLVCVVCLKDLQHYYLHSLCDGSLDNCLQWAHTHFGALIRSL